MSLRCLLGFHVPDGPPTTQYLDTRKCLRCGRIEINQYDFIHATTKWVQPK